MEKRREQRLVGKKTGRQTNATNREETSAEEMIEGTMEEVEKNVSLAAVNVFSH